MLDISHAAGITTIPYTIYRDVCLVTSEVGKCDGWSGEVSRHLERSTVLHHQLDDSLAGGDVGQPVLL